VLHLRSQGLALLQTLLHLRRETIDPHDGNLACLI
jgi:hypothetical protein